MLAATLLLLLPLSIALPAAPTGLIEDFSESLGNDALSLLETRDRDSKRRITSSLEKEGKKSRGAKAGARCTRTRGSRRARASG